MTNARIAGVIAALVLGACHSAVPPRVPRVSATSSSAGPSGPARADFDLASGARGPLQEDVATGHDPCHVLHSPIDDAPRGQHPLVIDSEARACRRRPLVQPRRMDEIPRN